MATSITPAPKWTISVIAQVDDNNRWEYDQLLRDITRNYDKGLRYVIFEFLQNDGTVKVRESSDQYPILTATSPEDQIWDITRGDFKDKKNVSLFDAQVYSYNKSPENPITVFLRDYVLCRDSDRQMLITWGHGAGLGYFYYGGPETGTKARNDLVHDIKGTDEFNQSRRSFNIKNVHHNIHLANLSLSLNDQSKLNRLRFGDKNPSDFFSDSERTVFDSRTKLLSADNLAEILRQSGFGPKEQVNVFIANNCWLNMFETGWALKDYVDVYVAPQTIIPFAGINYDKLFKALAKKRKQEIMPIDIARNITDSFLTKYTDEDESFAQEFREKRPDIEVREVSISANYLKRYDDIKTNLDELSSVLIKKLKTEKDSFIQRIDNARSYCGDFTQQGVSFVDFTTFFSELIKSFQSDDPLELKDLYKEFFFLKDNAQLSLLSSGPLYRFMPTDYYSQSPQMFSVYFPSRNGISEATRAITKLYPSKENFTEFQKTFGWYSFLKEYLDYGMNGKS